MLPAYTAEVRAKLEFFPIIPVYTGCIQVIMERKNGIKSEKQKIQFEIEDETELHQRVFYC